LQAEAAHGLHGLQADAAHGLQADAAHGLHGLQGLVAAQGLHGVQDAAICRSDPLAPAARGLQGIDVRPTPMPTTIGMTVLESIRL